MLAVPWNILLGRIFGGMFVALILGWAVLALVLGCIESVKAKKMVTKSQREEQEKEKNNEEKEE